MFKPSKQSIRTQRCVMRCNTKAMHAILIAAAMRRQLIGNAKRIALTALITVISNYCPFEIMVYKARHKQIADSAASDFSLTNLR